MINLENINISFDRKIIEKGKVCIHDNCITSVIGKSGSGKTTLLYLIGLISSNSEYKYWFDDREVNLKSDLEISRYKKEKIGYVFQDNSLIDTMSVRDNLLMSAKIAGITLKEEDINFYLKYVELEVNKKAYPKNLSGGEKQRLAIACALVKKPTLIIADEPTSALDDINTEMVINILKKYAREDNNKVVIATHNKDVYEISDVIYEISNEKIQIIKSEPVKKKSDINKDTLSDKKRALGIKFFLSYIFKNDGKKKFQKNLMLILCAIAIAFTVAVRNMGDVFFSNQSDLINTISDREIFTVNMSSPSNINIDCDENLSITKEDTEKIESIVGIDKVYGVIDLCSTYWNVNNAEYNMGAELSVKTDSNSKKYEFNEQMSSENVRRITVLPYFEEQSFDKQTKYNFETENDKKIYISSSLAERIELSGQEKNINLSMEIGVPVCVLKTEMQDFVDDEKYVYNIDVDQCEVYDLDVNIDGVLLDNVRNRYTINGENVIYVPYDMLKELIDLSQADYKKNTGENLKLINSDFEEWMPSAYVVFANNYNNVSSIINSIQKISPNYSAFSNYQDVENMNNILQNVKNTSTIIAIVILVIIFVLMTVIFTNYIVNRKYEIAILKSNGLTKKELLNMIIIETFILAIKIFMLGLLFFYLIKTVVNNLLFSYEYISFNAGVCIQVFVISLVSIIIPTVCSINVINRINPDNIMRN